jgi:hypothetical protein
MQNLTENTIEEKILKITFFCMGKGRNLGIRAKWLFLSIFCIFLVVIILKQRQNGTHWIAEPLPYSTNTNTHSNNALGSCSILLFVRTCKFLVSGSVQTRIFIWDMSYCISNESWEQAVSVYLFSFFKLYFNHIEKFQTPWLTGIIRTVSIQAITKIWIFSKQLR